MPKFCPSCGKPLQFENAEICPTCGVNLTSLNTPKKKDSERSIIFLFAAGTGILFLFFIIAAVIAAFIFGMAGTSTSPVQTPEPITYQTIVAPTQTPLPGEPVIIPSTPQMHQNGIVNNGVIMYRNPEKIIKPEDLQIGDIIQMSIDDPRWDKDHGFIVENISPQNNQYLIKHIVYFKSENTWFGMNTTNSVLITSGALMRDYPYIIGHALEPLPQKCLRCEYTLGGDVNWCSSDALRFVDCTDPRITSRSSSVIYPP